jgi:hypothetical protein
VSEPERERRLRIAQAVTDLHGHMVFLGAAISRHDRPALDRAAAAIIQRLDDLRCDFDDEADASHAR